MRRFLFVGLFFLPLALFAESIVFVHLGKNIPSCLFTTVKQAKYLNPDVEIYVLTDKEGYAAFNILHKEKLEERQFSLVNLATIPPTQEHKNFRQINQIDPRLLRGFWIYALERFFYLFDFIKFKRLENVIHLESDTMLYCDIQELLPLLERSEAHLAAPFESQVGCIPCFVFVKEAKSLEPLITHICSEMEGYRGVSAHIDMNDMQMLASFHAKAGDRALLRLPVLMPEYSYSKRVSDYAPDNSTDLDFLFSTATLFEGYIFDAATLGVFAGGNDRRYFSDTGPGIIHHRSLFDPGKFSFFWGEESSGKKVPYLSFKGKVYRIVNLHFHSKYPEGHTSYGEAQLEFCKESYE